MKDTEAMRQLHIYVPPDDVAAIEKMARAGDRTASAEIRIAIRDHIQRNSKKKAA